MLSMRLADAARALGAGLHGADVPFAGLATDSRRDVTGSLFVALKGPNHDGHDYLAQVAQAGAAGALVSRRVDGIDLPQLLVDDTLLALGRLAAFWRARCPARVVAVTGNAGKTTTREMVAAVLRSDGPVLATTGNLNNEIGVPLTLARLDAGHRYAVVEMGQGRPGDIAWLVEIARPDIALVTNVTGAHLANFGSLEAIADGKGEVYAKLAGDGVAIVNADDAFAPRWQAALPSCRVLTFGLADGADVRADDIHQRDDGSCRFTLRWAGHAVPVSLQIPGRHSVSNALAAAAVGVACGIDVVRIATSLAQVQPVGGRLRPRRLADGTRLIDDTYNANPGSMRAAIDTLAALGGTRVLVLGDMAELGPDAAQLHAGVAAHARVAGIEHLFVTGAHAGDYARGFGAATAVHADVETLVAALRPLLGAQVSVLVKGSRSARMERVVALLTGEAHAAVAH
jgi:UDP-N-acetylmuramoyl-tripeptide--D-alanyl-D-alanine ligase